MKETVLQLQKHDFIIMMDDFISGYSSLNILKYIPVDALKKTLPLSLRSKKDGSGGYRHEKIIYTNIFDDNGKPIRAVAVAEDVSESVLPEQNPITAMHDSLTGLYNRKSAQDLSIIN